ncbi:MAG: lamin tail domain-containing protein [Myxococcota bacterium]
MSLTHPTLIALLAVLLLAACGDSDAGDTSSEDAATQVESDTATEEDIALRSDAAVGDDVATSADSASSEDAGPMEDISTPDVASPEADTVPGDDASTSDDAVTTEDTTANSDAGSETDVSGPEDTGGAGDVTSDECSVPCDCAQQGADCIDGTCVLGTKPVFCCELDGCAEGEPCVTAGGADGLCGVATSSAFGVLIINEVLTDGAVDGDPNGDGDTPDAMGDEFVELVNAGEGDLDISGFQLFETDMPFVARHVFAEGTVVPAGAAMVVFGGGTAPDDLERAQFQVANASDPGIPLGLALNNDGDTLTVLDGDDLHVATFAYGPGAVLEAVTDESVARKPDVTGDWMGHTWAAGSPDALFSPGTKLDGTSF